MRHIINILILKYYNTHIIIVNIMFNSTWMCNTKFNVSHNVNHFNERILYLKVNILN